MKPIDEKCLPVYYFKQMKDIEQNLVTFLDKQDNLDENVNIFTEYLQNEKISDDKYKLKSFLYLIDAISNNYHRSQDFFLKIELILKSIQAKIQSHFTIFEIFHIFHRNKRVLLFLFKSKIIIPTEDIYSIIIGNKKYNDRKYLEYFFPEFEPYFDEKMKKSIQNQIKDSNDEFIQKRESGENDNYLCKLIQKDLIVDFISYLEKTNILPSSTIQSSIYETNLFLINKNPTLIEYSAFYGSIQIFKYLYNQKVEVKTSIWPYAIHGKNAEIIKLLEENNIKTLNDTFQYLIIESIKCHHNEIADYFRSNISKEEKIYDYYLYRKSLKYYNFAFFTDDDIVSLINSCKDNQKLNIAYYCCKYDYFLFVEYLFKNDLDVNYQYTIYKPVVKCKDISKRIAIKNGDLMQESEEEDQYYNDIEKKYSTYEYDVETSTILNIAIRKGNIEIIQFLLKLPKINININSAKSYKEFYPRYTGVTEDDDFKEYYCIIINNTILNEAIESGYVDVFQFLLNNVSFDVNCKLLKKKIYVDCFSTANMYFEENYEKRLLHHAIERENIGIIKLLLSNPNIDINLNSKSTIKESGGCICYTSTKKTIEKSTLYFAVENGNLKLIQFLLTQPGININSGIKEISISRYNSNSDIIQNKSPLYLAVEKGNLEIVKILVGHSKINVDFVSTLCKYQGNREKARKTAFIGKTNIEQDNYDCLIFCVRNIKYIQIPNFIKYICSYSFDHCSQLEEIFIPSDSKLETIDKYAFSSSKIKSITIPSSVTSIEERAFSFCQQLEKIIMLSDSKLETIDKYAFSSSRIKSITIPPSITSFGEGSFANCIMLQIIEINNREMISISEKNFENCKNILLMIPFE